MTKKASQAKRTAPSKGEAIASSKRMRRGQEGTEVEEEEEEEKNDELAEDMQVEMKEAEKAPVQGAGEQVETNVVRVDSNSAVNPCGGVNKYSESLGWALLHRKKELQHIYLTMDRNFNRRVTGDKPLLIFACQRRGVGKTALGKNLFNFKCKTVKEAFESTPGLSAETREKMSRALTIFVPLDYKPRQHSSLQANVASQMWKAALSCQEEMKYSYIKNSWEAKPDFKRNVFSCFKDLVELLKTPLYFFFDRIHCVEEYPNEMFEMAESRQEGKSISDRVKDSRLREFINLFQNILFDPNCFVFCAGINFLSPKLGSSINLSQAPVVRESLSLCSFSKSDISDILTSLRYCERCNYIYQDFGLTQEDRLHSFVSWLYRVSCGVPFNVVMILQELYHDYISCRNVKEIFFVSGRVVEYNVEWNMFKYMDRFNPRAWPLGDEKDRKLKSYIIVAVFKRTIFKVTDEIPGTSMSVMQLIERYCLAFVRCSDSSSTHRRVIMPASNSRKELLEKQLQSAHASDRDSSSDVTAIDGNSSNHAGHELIMLQLPWFWATRDMTAQFLPHGMFDELLPGTDAGFALKPLLARRFMLAGELCQHFECSFIDLFPFLASTELVRKPSFQAFSKVLENSGKAKDTTGSETKPRSQRQAIGDLFCRNDDFLYYPDPAADESDVILFFQIPPLAKSSTSSSPKETLVIGFHTRNTADAISKANLCEELAKCHKFLRARMKMLLVVVSLGGVTEDIPTSTLITEADKPAILQGLASNLDVYVLSEEEVLSAVGRETCEELRMRVGKL